MERQMIARRKSEESLSEYDEKEMKKAGKWRNGEDGWKKVGKLIKGIVEVDNRGKSDLMVTFYFDCLRLLSFFHNRHQSPF